MRELTCRSGLLLAAAIVALIAAGIASAERQPVRLTSAGQAAARAVVVTRADLGTSAAWTGGARKPDLSSTSPCPGYQPKQSDLVLNGAARTTWQSPGIQIDSHAQVLGTGRMVELDWQRSVRAPQVLPCVRYGLAKKLGSSVRLVSIRWVPFPRVARYTAAVRALLDARTPSGTVRVMSDIVLFGEGRTELILTVTAPLAAQASVRQAEIRLARVLASRIRL